MIYPACFFPIIAFWNKHHLIVDDELYCYCYESYYGIQVILHCTMPSLETFISSIYFSLNFCSQITASRKNRNIPTPVCHNANDTNRRFILDIVCHISHKISTNTFTFLHIISHSFPPASPARKSLLQGHFGKLKRSQCSRKVAIASATRI